MEKETRSIESIQENLKLVISKIVEVYKPEIYDTEVTVLNKPMADIPAGHILNINWDNICGSFKALVEVNKESLEYIQELLKRCPYGVGDILITSSNTNPVTRWPGTSWKRITEGFIHPVVDEDDLFKTINKTGGVYKTKLSLNQMPEHEHDVGGLTDTRWGFAPSVQQAGEQFKSGKGGMLWKLKTNKVGGNEDLNILPKYITKYIWERVA